MIPKRVHSLKTTLLFCRPDWVAPESVRALLLAGTDVLEEIRDAFATCDQLP